VPLACTNNCTRPTAKEPTEAALAFGNIRGKTVPHEETIMTIIKSGAAKTKVGELHPLIGSFSAELISDTGNLTQFGAFVETLTPGSKSSLLHWHSDEDELVYMLKGTVIVHEGDVRTVLSPGDTACFKAGEPVGHCLENTSGEDATYFLVGTRSSADIVTYPGRNRRIIRKDGKHWWTDEAGAPGQDPYSDPV
jgi:uncharacterized cupin superfamily protein